MNMVWLGDARRVIAAAEKKAQQFRQPMNIAVVDADRNANIPRVSILRPRTSQRIRSGRPVMTNKIFRVVPFIKLTLTAICSLVILAPLQAQSVTGTILGLIQDQQGAIIAKANVSARNVDTGAVREAIAGDGGEYRITSVPAGSYEVSSSAPGFKTDVRNGIVVRVGSDIAVNFALTVGAISEKVDVTDQTPQVDVSSSTLAGFVNSASIRELPLNGRDWLQMALLQPGVNFLTATPPAEAIHDRTSMGLAISISGGRPSDNAFRIDGLMVNDFTNNGPGSSLHVNMGVDAIREFSVLINSFSAEYGMSSGGVVNAITKSGTNQIHGSTYYFHRNSAFDARNFFDLTVGTPAFRRHQGGGAVGGPIKKDKTFFFSNYEGLTELRSTSSSVNTLSANAHNGILCANTACTQTTQVSIDPRIKPYLALYPLPNGAVTGDTGVFGYGAAKLGHENYVMSKIDHYFSPATTLAGSFTSDNTFVNLPDNFGLKSADYPSRKYNAVLSLQHVFSPNVVNIFRGGVSRTYAASAIDRSTNPALNDVSLGSIPGRTMSAFTLPAGVGSFGGVGAGDGLTGRGIFGFTTPQIYNDLSWTKGRHPLQMGSSFERILYNMDLQLTPNGRWTFTSFPRFLQGTPDQFIADLPESDVVRGQRMSVIGGYLQDAFRMRSNLTLNLGVRYEMGTVIKEVNGKTATLHNILDTKPTIGDPYYHNPTRKNFAPRVGFAWDPFKNGKTSVRGGFGIYYIVPLPYLFLGKMPRSAPFAVNGTVSAPPASAFPNRIVPLLTTSSLSVANIEQNPRPAYKQQWNLNIQRQLINNLALTVGYFGSAGIHLARPVEDNNQVPPHLVTFNPALNAYVFPIPAAGQPIARINPNFGLIRTLKWNGQSNYHALVANLVQRPVKGLSYQVAYTWSKSIDNGSTTYTEGTESNNATASSYTLGPTNINRGVSDWDIPHNLVVNFQYDLPVPQAVKAHVLANTLFGGWQVGGIYTRQSGSPFSLKISSDRALTGSSTSTPGNQGSPPPMYVNAPGCSPNAVTGNIDNYIKTECFAYPQLGVLGNLGRHTLRMKVFRNLDFSVFKNQNIRGETLKAQFRAEMFNILNNTNLAAQGLAIFDGNGALIQNVGRPRGPTANTSRQIQFGLRLLF